MDFIIRTEEAYIMRANNCSERWDQDLDFIVRARIQP